MARDPLPSDYGVRRIVDPWPDELAALASRYAPGFELTPYGSYRQTLTLATPTWVDADAPPPWLPELVHDHRSDIQDLGALVEVNFQIGDIPVRLSTPLTGAPLAGALRALGGHPRDADPTAPRIELVCLPSPSRRQDAAPAAVIATSKVMERVVLNGAATPSLARAALLPLVQARLHAQGAALLTGAVSIEPEGATWFPDGDGTGSAGTLLASRWFALTADGQVRALDQGILTPPHDSLSARHAESFDAWIFVHPGGEERVIPVEAEDPEPRRLARVVLRSTGKFSPPGLTATDDRTLAWIAERTPTFDPEFARPGLEAAATELVVENARPGRS